MSDGGVLKSRKDEKVKTIYNDFRSFLVGSGEGLQVLAATDARPEGLEVGG